MISGAVQRRGGSNPPTYPRLHHLPPYHLPHPRSTYPSAPPPSEGGVASGLPLFRCRADNLDVVVVTDVLNVLPSEIAEVGGVFGCGL